MPNCSRVHTIYEDGHEEENITVTSPFKRLPKVCPVCASKCIHQDKYNGSAWKDYECGMCLSNNYGYDSHKVHAIKACRYHTDLWIEEQNT